MFSSFMTNAWIAGSTVAIIAGMMGFFVVLRSSAFAAHAIPNGAFAGAAGANLLGVDPLFGLISFSLLAAWGIGTVSRRERSDVVTALALVLMLATGAAFLSLTTSYASAINPLLFGEILGVSSAQIAPIGIVAAICVVTLAVGYRPMLYASVAPQLAESRGVRADRMNVLFLIVMALATALTVPVVGTLLTFSLMMGPAATARLLVERPGRALMLSVVLALVTIWVSIASSYLWNWPIGFFVGTLGVVQYVTARLMRARLSRGVRSRSTKVRQAVRPH